MTPDFSSFGNYGREVNILHACPMCHAAFNPLKTQILAERGGQHLLFLECRHCGTGTVALIEMDAEGMAVTGALTDLTATEMSGLLERKSAVADNDIIEFHQWINDDQHALTLLRPVGVEY